MSTKGILKAGDKIQTNLTGASNYDLKVGGVNVSSATSSITLGPYEDDQFYELTVNSGEVSVSCYDALINGVTPSVTLANLGSAQIAGVGAERAIKETKAIITSNGSAFIGVLYRNNTPISSSNSVASNFKTPVAGFTVPAGAMDKDSTLIIDMTMRVFDTVSATRIVRVFADTQQIAAYSFTSTSGLIPMQFRMSNCGDAGAQLQSSGLTINGTEQATVNARQIDTAGHDTEITITVETPSGQMIKQALFVELK